tara:strand:- start:2406 stop:3104 length:699 start_codon:yes stop_codon:yes gene_type:complete
MLKSILSSLFSSVQTKTIDNDVGGIDIVGSWVEFGLVGVAILAGIFFSLPVLMKAMENRRKKKPYLTGDYWQCHSRVHEILTELRVNLDCARTQVVQFHNGGNFFDGNPMAKMTMTHESLRNGLSPESPNWRDLQIPLMIHLLEKSKNLSDGIYLVNDEDDSYAKQQLSAANVLAYAVSPLYKGNSFSGFVMCQWCAWSKVDEVDETKVAKRLNDAAESLEIELDRESRRTR